VSRTAGNSPTKPPSGHNNPRNRLHPNQSLTQPGKSLSRTYKFAVNQSLTANPAGRSPHVASSDEPQLVWLLYFLASSDAATSLRIELSIPVPASKLMESTVLAMTFEWSDFWGSIGALFAAAAFAVVGWQEIRRWRERPFVSWKAAYEKVDWSDRDGWATWEITLIAHADFEVRSLRFMGNKHCRMPNHEADGKQIPYVSIGERITINALVEEAHEDEAWIVLYFEIPPLRKQLSQANWIPAVPSSVLEEDIHSWKALSPWRRWQITRKSPYPSPGGPPQVFYTPRSQARRIRRMEILKESLRHKSTSTD